MREIAEDSTAEQESYRAQLLSLTIDQVKQIAAATAYNNSFSNLNKFRLKFKSSLKPVYFEASKAAYDALFTKSGRARK